MSDSDAIDLALLLLRLGVGAVMLAHGIRHVFGGGKIAGTARWFGVDGDADADAASVAGEPHRGRCRDVARARTVDAIGGGGRGRWMAVAWIANHFKNGFFIFNKGEGYEYVMTLLLCGVVLGTVGPGQLVAGRRARDQRRPDRHDRAAAIARGGRGGRAVAAGRVLAPCQTDCVTNRSVSGTQCVPRRNPSRAPGA